MQNWYLHQCQRTRWDIHRLLWCLVLWYVQWAHNQEKVEISLSCSDPERLILSMRKFQVKEHLYANWVDWSFFYFPLKPTYWHPFTSIFNHTFVSFIDFFCCEDSSLSMHFFSVFRIFHFELVLDSVPPISVLVNKPKQVYLYFHLDDSILCWVLLHRIALIKLKRIFWILIFVSISKSIALKLISTLCAIIYFLKSDGSAIVFPKPDCHWEGLTC